MQLNIETIYDDGTGNIGVSSHEPDDSFYTYILENDTITDYESVANKNTFYPFQYPQHETPPSITILESDNFGVKKSTGWGSGAFYHPIDSEYSYLVLPLHRDLKNKEAPNISYSINGKTISFTITLPKNIKYECVRIIAKQNALKTEQVDYFKKGIINTQMEIPYSGNVIVTVQAYSEEIDVVSKTTTYNISI